MRKQSQTSFEEVGECSEKQYGTEWPWSPKTRTESFISCFTVTKTLNLSQVPPLSLGGLLSGREVFLVKTSPRDSVQARAK